MIEQKQKPRLLLHTCCGPCLTRAYEVLSSKYAVDVLFYNPNISPISEYNKRLSEVEQFSKLHNIAVKIGPYNQKEWFNKVKPYRFFGEVSERCYICYRMRLEYTFSVAKNNNYDAVCTTLTVSPYKNANKINEIGNEISLKYKVNFIEEDFKKDDGYKRSIELSKQYNMYRQKYCGCIYSKLERKKVSLWSLKVKEYQAQYKQNIDN